MTESEAKKIIRQRTSPRITDFCYLTTRAHLRAFRRFVEMLRQEPSVPRQVLDLGCGQKPFRSFLQDVSVGQYVGVDFDSQRSTPDVIAPVDDLPVPDNTFNTVIATEVFEHTEKLEQAVAELRRVSVNGALVYISTPFMFPEHGTPYDFQRITRYKYQSLFKNDKILLVQETNSSLATPFFFFNVTLENIALLKYIPLLPSMVYAWNNLWGLLGEALVGLFTVIGRRFFRSRSQWFADLRRIYFYQMPGGFDVIVQVQK